MDMQHPEPEKTEQAPLKAEQAFLVELKAQGRKAQKHRDWERQVLFLKESDEDTRLDTLFEILLKRLDLPTAGMETEDFPEWEKEHREALSFLYQEPDLPEPCGPSGALTKDIRRLTSLLVQPAVNLTPPGVVPHARSEIGEVPVETARLRSARNWLVGWFVAYLYISVCFFTLLGICCLDLLGLTHLDQPPLSGPGHAVSATIFKALIFAGGAFGTLFVAILLGRRWKRKEAELQVCQRELQERNSLLGLEADQMEPESCLSYELATAETGKARQRLLHDLIEAVQKWRAVVRKELVRNFFEQGLWINDMFAECLRALLAEIQRPFPASCRVEINCLRDDQIKSAFTVLTAVIASSIAAKVDLGNSGTLAQLIVSGAEPGVPVPSAAVVLEKLESEGVLLDGDQLSDDTTACMTEILNTLRA
jgi:hypothetical protein